MSAVVQNSNNSLWANRPAVPLQTGPWRRTRTRQETQPCRANDFCDLLHIWCEGSDPDPV